jgi:hypothetical protein
MFQRHSYGLRSNASRTGSGKGNSMGNTGTPVLLSHPGQGNQGQIPLTSVTSASTVPTSNIGTSETIPAHQHPVQQTASPYGAGTTISGTENVLHTLFSDAFDVSNFGQQSLTTPDRVGSGKNNEVDESTEITFDPLKSIDGPTENDVNVETIRMFSTHSENRYWT